MADSAGTQTSAERAQHCRTAFIWPFTSGNWL